MLKDGIVLQDREGKVTFNHYSFCELLKYLMVELAGISYEHAAELVEESPLSEPTDDIDKVGLYSHEYCYFWAMHICYGHCYWHKGIPAQPEDMDAYMRLEDRIIQEHQLKEPFEWK